jgi:hypothetical protein
MVIKKLFCISGLMFILLLGLTGCQSPPATPSVSAYGAKVSARESQPVQFPDITVEYMGKRREQSPQFPPGFLYFDYKIRHGEQEQLISWSSGTGDIGPVRFEMGDGAYLLERAFSDKLGRLNENELVIWKLK